MVLRNVPPLGCRPVGYAALIERYGLTAPLPLEPACVSERHKPAPQQEGWRVHGRRLMPEDSLAGHLEFALKHEAVDLLALKRLFEAVDDREIAACVRAKPTGIYMRRAWFLHEWLTGRQLDIPDLSAGNYIEALDPGQHCTLELGPPSQRHRVRNNLPGTPGFCPIVRRTAAVSGLSAVRLRAMLDTQVAGADRTLLRRAAGFLLLKDSQASFRIENDLAPRDRLERWGRAVTQASASPLTLEEFPQLQEVVIGDQRFVQRGWRRDGVFVGDRDRRDGSPRPDWIGARPGDVEPLMASLVEAGNRMIAGGVEPVAAAATVSFGMVYIHPFQDGNGRIHRALIHKMLTLSGAVPQGLILPVAAALEEEIEAYRTALESHSERAMPFIQWRGTAAGNVEVLNETADLYRYFDATPHAELLSRCLETTIEHDLPGEIDWLRRQDRALVHIRNVVELPDDKAMNLVRFCVQNGGRLGAKKRRKFFPELTDQEIGEIEAICQDVFEIEANTAPEPD